MQLRVIIKMISMNRQEKGKRDRVFQELMGRKDHPTAEELYLTLREKGEAISLATVYRALHALAEEGLVTTLPLVPAERFDPTTHPHYHFHCLRCDRVFDLELPYKPELDRAIEALGFSVHHHTLVFHGLCPACQAQRERGGP
ncbi:MAG: transcriptional repressor [Candidatus Methanomethyliaceae archaeon]